MINLAICWKAIGIILGILLFVCLLIIADEWKYTDKKWKDVIGDIVRILLVIMLVVGLIVALIGLYFAIAEQSC